MAGFSNGGGSSGAGASGWTSGANSITSIPSAIGNYFTSAMADIKNEIYVGIYNQCAEIWTKIGQEFNTQLSHTTDNITNGMNNTFSGSLSLMRTLSQTVFIPIAGVFLTVILCWELVQIIQNYNTSNDLNIQRIFLILLKLGMCIMVCSRSFDIVMFFFNIGQSVSSKIAGHAVNPTASFGSFDTVIPPLSGNAEIKDIMSVFIALILVLVVRIAMIILTMLIYVKVLLWFMEVLIYSAPASIPMATWMNREWSMLGMNYSRRMLALAFEGPFMLLVFTMYGTIVNEASSLASGGDYMTTMICTLGGAFACFFMLKRIPQLSMSIFSAH